MIAESSHLQIIPLEGYDKRISFHDPRIEQEASRMRRIGIRYVPSANGTRSTRALSGNIGSLSLPVRALDDNILWSGRKVSESDSDVQRQSRGRISRAQTDRAATKPSIPKGRIMKQALLFSECLFRAAASAFTPRGPKADSQSTRRSTRRSQNSQERRFPSSKAGMRVHVQIVRSFKELIKRWSLIRVH
jgi:hypothetical protein